MEREDYIAALRRDGLAMAEAARGNLSANVPSCPEWDVRELMRHTGGVHRFWGQVADKQLSDPKDGEDIPIPESDDELLTWFEEGVVWLADVLKDLDPSRPNWSWSPHKTAGFVQRRMAQETAVHRWDAELAAGTEQPIEPVLAADGVSELFDTFIPAEDTQPTGNGETMLLHQTDGDGDWLVRFTPSGLQVTAVHEKGDAGRSRHRLEPVARPVGAETAFQARNLRQPRSVAKAGRLHRHRLTKKSVRQVPFLGQSSRNSAKALDPLAPGT